MSIFNICVMAVIGVLVALNLKSQKAEYATFVSLALCVLILVFSLDRLGYIVEMITGLTDVLALDLSYITLLLKLIGVAYVSEFAATLCKEAGFGAIGGQIELTGKLTMIFLSVPIVFTVMETIAEFLN